LLPWGLCRDALKKLQLMPFIVLSGYPQN